MPLNFATGPKKNFTPKTVKFSDLYKFSSGNKGMSGTVLEQARETLAAAGYTSTQITKIITEDKSILAPQMKEIAGLMNQNKIYGFNQDGAILMKNYLNKQRIKAQNISRVQHEHMLEAMGEDLDKGKPATSLNNMGKKSSTSLNSLGQKPNTPSSGSTHISLPY
ncbi:MAG: hypothetical protein WCV92_03285 [Candidatus Buchananbacteria bacterium]